MIWLYALTDNPSAQLPAVAGHGARELVQTRDGELAGVWSSWSQGDPGARGSDGLLRQEMVLEALMRDRTVLPLRFGTVLEDTAALQDMMITRRDEWLVTLKRVRGCVEMAVRAGVPTTRTSPNEAAESGAEYLRRRGHENANAALLTRTVHARLAEISSASEAQSNAGEGAQLTASYLVPTPGVDGFKLAVTRLAEEDPGLAITCTGPWPPYSFVHPGDRFHDRRVTA